MLRPRLNLVAARMLSVLATLVVLAAPAVGSPIEGPPTPNIRGGANLLLGYAIMFVLVALVVVVSLYPSKRGHQD